MKAIIKKIIPGSPAAKTKIVPGDAVCKINGHIINDVLDYEYHSYDSRLIIELVTEDNRVKLIKLFKQEGTDLGLEFETYLMDKERSCANKCIFCFIDQLPDGMRESLYYKDDDVRLSFLQGNYVTLTNLSEQDLKRMIDLRISPINVSVHSLDPELRAFLLGTKAAGRGVDALKTIANAGIKLNCQIVCCPGINDGPELSKTIEGFIKLGQSINSVSIVPVGLTKHRQGLMELRPFDKTLALQTVKLVENYAENCMKSHGSRQFFCADELFMMAGLELPDNEFYEDYPQLENGVGMMRLFITEFEEALKQEGETVLSAIEAAPAFSIVTGVLAHKYLENLLDTTIKKYGTIKGDVHAIRNDFFGESVTVSGLITGRDIISQLKGKTLGSKLLIPQNMLRHGEEVFLDDVTVTEISNALGVPVRILRQSGADLVKEILSGH